MSFKDSTLWLFTAEIKLKLGSKYGEWDGLCGWCVLQRLWGQGSVDTASRVSEKCVDIGGTGKNMGRTFFVVGRGQRSIIFSRGSINWNCAVCVLFSSPSHLKPFWAVSGRFHLFRECDNEKARIAKEPSWPEVATGLLTKGKPEWGQ